MKSRWDRVRSVGACVAVVSVFGVGISACTSESGAGSTAEASSSATSSTSVVLSAEAVEQRGGIVRIDDAPDSWSLPDGTVAKRLVYRSTSGVDGSSTTVSGAAFVPGSIPPAGGWPLIAYAHGTTGITPDCAPSDQADMFGDLTAVRDFLDAGYAVVTTDYQGLGTRTGRQAPHPYLEPLTAAYNVIDAARAAQSSALGISPRWLAAGRSQGGAAVWSAAEEFGGYGGGSGELLGVVAVAPLLDPQYFATRAQENTLTRAQQHLYPLVVHGVSQADPAVNPADHLSALDSSAVPVCGEGRTAVSLLSVPAHTSLGAVTPQAAQTLHARLEAYALPRTGTTVPILAVYGAEDDVIPTDVMEDTITRACGIGDQVLSVRHEQQGHIVDPGPDMAAWVRDRVAGLPAPSNC
ncbi:lipase family protein [Gordonia alkanivorans]|uniref:alpha/beta hydrolase family protein n=1 Tax=Gordonia TaxID=2053 RepID=UPI00244971CF|nr:MULTISPECIES: lipase family protein [Gordonia]MDH3017397.1 lipase family protein [Gordonia alkanivorans]MDH3042743.1 lipase family protein [Gordonia alkanivorans]WJG14447.1 lipase family protein [Gordonia sp. Swx-4]